MQSLCPIERGFARTATPLGERVADVAAEVASARQGGKSLGQGVFGRRNVSLSMSMSTFECSKNWEIVSFLCIIPLQFQTAILNDLGSLAEEAIWALSGSKP